MRSSRTITVRPVTDSNMARQFVELPFRIYEDDPLWVPPLRSAVHKIISPKHNPFFSEAEIENFVALDGEGRAVGRISASIHAEYNQRFGSEHVFFGFLEVENDFSVAQM